MDLLYRKRNMGSDADSNLIIKLIMYRQVTEENRIGMTREKLYILLNYCTSLHYYFTRVFLFYFYFINLLNVKSKCTFYSTTFV